MKPAFLPVDADAERRTGFSLVELLVALAIVAALAGILLPVASYVRENAKQAKCVGNLRQLGTAINLYANENQDYLPVGRGQVNGAGPVVTWCGLVAPYVHASGLKSDMRNDYAVYCPSTVVGGIGIHKRDPSQWRTDYSYSEKPFEPRKRSSLSAGVILIYDGGGSGTAANQKVSPRHSEGVNCLFVGGQVQWFQKSLPGGTPYWIPKGF